MDWESKFSSIVRETESNLAKVKHKLGTPYTPTQSFLSRNGFNHTTGTGDAFSLSSHSDPGQSPLFWDPSHNTGGTIARTNRPGLYGMGPNYGIVADDLHSPSLDHSPAIAALLQEKLEEQSRAIEMLTRTVRRLEDEKNLYQKHMKDLRDEVSTLQSRVAERGVDLATERKVEQWRRDMNAELQVMQGKIQLNRSHDDSFNAMSAATREVNDVRRHIHDECDTLRRELDTLKGRLVKLELEQTSTFSENRDIVRRQDKLEQNPRSLLSTWQSYYQSHDAMTTLGPDTLSTLTATQTLRGMKDATNAASRDLGRTRDDLDSDKLQITELKSSLRDLNFKLGDIKNRIQPSPELPRLTSHKNLKKNTRQLHSTGLTATVHDDLLSPNTSDLDLSDTELEDFQSSELSLSQLSPNNNKLYRPASGVDEDLSLDDLTYSEDLLSTGLDTEDLV